MQSKHNQNEDALDVAKKAKQIWCSILIFPTNLVIMIMTMIKIRFATCVSMLIILFTLSGSSTQNKNISTKLKFETNHNSVA